ncbi:MAG: hypothetical protein HZB43_09235 [candidate division Zixibacteria bacterium]|nr:hypothetical protein [candidate division Zixibacteria bacterium]
MFLMLALFLFWPILQGAPPQQYIELSKFWKEASVIETGMTRPLAVITCPSKDSVSDGWLIAADSSGKLAEYFSDGNSWTARRSFTAGTPLLCICAAAPKPDMDFHLYGGTKTGQIIEVSRGVMGWSKHEIMQLPGPIKTIFATEAGGGGIPSVLFVIDGNGKIYQLIPPDLTFTDVPGGASLIVAHHYGQRLWAAAAGAKGDIYRYVRDSLGIWHTDPWAKMAAGPKYFAAAIDPSLRDIAVYYAGNDGLFRFLFLGYTEDKKARVPVADGASNILGGGTQRRFNEFFGISNNEFCMFEFNFDDKAWHKVPIDKIEPPVVSTNFGFGVNDRVAQMYVMGANGKIHQFVRYKN